MESAPARPVIASLPPRASIEAALSVPDEIVRARVPHDPPGGGTLRQRENEGERKQRRQDGRARRRQRR